MRKGQFDPAACNFQRMLSLNLILGLFSLGKKFVILEILVVWNHVTTHRRERLENTVSGLELLYVWVRRLLLVAFKYACLNNNLPHTLYSFSNSHGLTNVLRSESLNESSVCKFHGHLWTGLACRAAGGRCDPGDGPLGGDRARIPPPFSHPN